jgi:hypothetical protein
VPERLLLTNRSGQNRPQWHRSPS